MMKVIFNSIVLIIAILVYRPGYSQRIVSNSLLFYIDDSYVETDTMVSKNNLTIADCYRCLKNTNGDDSCILVSQTAYDKAGRIIELLRGDNLSNKQIDFVVSYKWLSDTTMESIVKYPPSSTMLPESYYIDTLIKGSKRRIYLFKTDKNKDIHVRSVYSMDASGFWKEIKRYDLNNKLVEIYFPMGNNVPKQNWSEMAVSNYDSIITESWDYGDYIIRSKNVYSKKGALKEVWDMTRWSGRSDSSITRSVCYYNENGHLSVKNNIDQDNQLLSEIRLYY
jgi:hypothetical protein